MVGARGGGKYEELGPEAERLYVEDGLGLPEISQRLGVSEVTLRQWRDFGDWQGQRKKKKETVKSLRERIIAAAEQVVANIELRNPADLGTADLDALAKANKLLQSYTDPTETVRIGVSTIMKFMDRLKAASPETAAAAAEIAAAYLDELWEGAKR